MNFQKGKKKKVKNWRASAAHGTPTFMARGRGYNEGAVATRARAAEESERSGRVKPEGASGHWAAESSGARRVGAVSRRRSGLWGPARRCALEPRSRRRSPAGSKGRARPGRKEGAAGPARARRRLFRGEALPLQRPSATAVIKAFQPQMWA